MPVRIYKPSKSATQSGRARTEQWILEYDNNDSLDVEPLMGWTSSEDTRNQIRLRFDSKDEAISYAEKEGLDYTLSAVSVRKVKPRNYTDNFKYQPPEDDKKA